MNYLLKLFKQNTVLKLLALFMSMVACTSVRLLTTPARDDTISHRVYNLPIKYTAPGASLLYEADEKEVVVTARGPLAVLNKITPELLVADVDLSAYTKPGSAVESIQVRAPNGVKITNVNPSYTWVRVSKRSVKAVPVRVTLQGQVQSGYSVDTPVVYPLNAQISGAEANVERVEEVRVPVVVSGLSSSLSVAARTLIPIDNKGENVEGIDVTSPNLSITVPVYALVQASVKLDNLKVVAAPNYTYTLSVNPKTVLLDTRGQNGQCPKFVRIQPKTVRVGKEPQELTVPVVLPSGVSLAQGSATEVVVTVTPHPKSAGNSRRNSAKQGKK